MAPTAATVITAEHLDFTDLHDPAYRRSERPWECRETPGPHDIRRRLVQFAHTNGFSKVRIKDLTGRKHWPFHAVLRPMYLVMRRGHMHTRFAQLLHRRGYDHPFLPPRPARPAQLELRLVPAGTPQRRAYSFAFPPDADGGIAYDNVYAVSLEEAIGWMLRERLFIGLPVPDGDPRQVLGRLGISIRIGAYEYE